MGRVSRRGINGAVGGCPAGLPHDLTHGRTLSAAASPPRACLRLPSEAPQECGNLTRAGSAVPEQGCGHLSTLSRLEGPARCWQPPNPAQDGADVALVWAQCPPYPTATLAPPDPQKREGGTGSVQAGCAPGNPDWGGMETGGGTSSWPCPFTHKCNPFTPKGHTCVHSTPRTQTAAPELRVCTHSRGLARPRWVLHPHPHQHSHTHVPTARPWAPPPFPAPRAPPRPQFLFTVMEPPARPSRHRGGGYRGIAGAAASPVPGTGAAGFPAAGCAGSPHGCKSTAHSGNSSRKS